MIMMSAMTNIKICSNSDGRHNGTSNQLPIQAHVSGLRLLMSVSEIPILVIPDRMIVAISMTGEYGMMK